MRVTVTGGAGYIGATATRELLPPATRSRVLDSLLHGQDDVAAALEAAGARVVRGDVRDADARRAALDGADAVVHLAAIVGDPACAKDPELSQAVNVEGTRALVEDAGMARRIVFASTCSNYGRMADPLVPVDETAPLAPVSLYAEQKVEIERELLALPNATCLRFATIYGVAERMRFDLTVNEFTRDLWDGRTLDVYGEQFWRPYVHVGDAARRWRWCSRHRGARRRPRVQRRPQRRELPQARPRRADPRAAARGRRALRAARRGPARLPRLVRAHPLRARLRPRDARARRRRRADRRRSRSAASATRSTAASRTSRRLSAESARARPAAARRACGRSLVAATSTRSASG